MAYATVADVRAISKGDDVSDASVFDDAVVTNGITFAEQLVDRHTGNSFEFKAFTSTTDGNGSDWADLINGQGRPIFDLATITAATVDAVVLASGVYSAWLIYPSGLVVRDDGSNFPCGFRNVVIAGTAGFSVTAPDNINHATALIARHWVLGTKDRVADRALQIANEHGLTVFAQPGKFGPTGIPEVNAILNDPQYNRLLPGVG